MDVTFDIESRSKVNLTTEGMYRYTRDISTTPLCWSWMIDDGPYTKTRDIFETTGTCDYELRLLAESDALFHAFNAQFEIEFWQNILTPRYGWPVCPPLERWRDTMAECGVAGYPQNLFSTSRLVGSEIKLSEGDKLINFFCTPDKKTGLFNNPLEHPYAFDGFKRYNRQDVVAERSVHNFLRGLMSENEQRVWQSVVKMNQRGLPIDIKSLSNIIAHVEKDVEYMGALISVLTNYEITKATQGQRIRDYASRYGVQIDSLTAEVVEDLLEKDKQKIYVLPNNLRKVLQFRKLGSGSSVGKFKKINDQICDDETIKGNLRYYGAGPGRHSGMGFQPQNLPRYKHKDPERVLYHFNSCSYEELRLYYDVSKAAKGLIRPIIKAPEGYELFVNDYKGIEARGVCWLCGEEELLEMFRKGYDIYIVQAAQMFNVPQSEIKNPSNERQAGKICILACGYAGGYIVFLKEAAKSKFECTESQAKQYVNSFRLSRPKVTAAWKNFELAAIEAMLNPGDIVKVENIRVTFQKFKSFLRMYLPSGRFIYYPKAEIRMGFNNFGKQTYIVSSYWTDSKTHQWTKRDMSGPLFFQNAIQGLCRDILVNAQIRLEDTGYPQIGSVHDEAITMLPKFLGRKLEDIDRIMLEVPEWATGFPLALSGYVGERYKKD